MWSARENRESPNHREKPGAVCAERMPKMQAAIVADHHQPAENPMINRKNYKMVRTYLEFRRTEIGSSSIVLEENHLKLLLEFAGELDFQDLPESDRSFQQYVQLLETHRAGKQGRLSYEYIRKIVSTARRFFEWARDERLIRKVPARWLRNFRVRATESTEPPQGYTIEEICKIASTPINTLAHERMQAAACMLFLSGMRISAFLTIPIMAVDIQNRTINQYPELGVHTKNAKRACTKILDFENQPIIFDVVKRWHEKILAVMPPTGMWFAPINPQTYQLDPDAIVGKNRTPGFRKDLIEFLEIAGVPYKSPHRFRHGVIRTLRDQAETTRHLEVICALTMQTMSTMLKYGRLNPSQARDEIDALANRNQATPGTPIDRPLAPEEDTPPQAEIDRVLKYFQELVKK